MYFFRCITTHHWFQHTRERERDRDVYLKRLWSWSFRIIGSFQNTSGHAAHSSVGDLKINSFEVPSGVFRWFLMDHAELAAESLEKKKPPTLKGKKVCNLTGSGHNLCYNHKTMRFFDRFIGCRNLMVKQKFQKLSELCKSDHHLPKIIAFKAWELWFLLTRIPNFLADS